MENEEIVRRAWDTFAPELAQQGYELIEVEYAGSYAQGRILRLFIDSPKGITIDDCTAASRVVSLLLDTEDWISEDYALEVSSPGIDRPLRKPEDFARFTGERVKLQTVAPVAGRKRFKGILRGIEDGLLQLESEDGAGVAIHLENLKKANLDR